MTDREINEAINAGVTNVGTLMSELKVATQCGGCLNEVTELLENNGLNSPSNQLVVPVMYQTK